jgi:hypothetical protein
MATKKIIFFSAGIGLTGPETTALNKLLARTDADYEVVIRNAAAPTTGAMVEDCDFVAGTLPASGDYDEIDEIDEDAIPAQNLLATEAIVADGQALVVPVTGVYATTATVSVTAGVVDGIVLS